MKPSVLLAKAKRVIQEKGWCQHEYHKEGDGYCIFGAVGIAKGIGDDGATPDDLRYITKAIGVVANPFFWTHPVVNWNDAPGRTKRQVLSVFDKAIKLAKKAGE